MYSSYFGDAPLQREVSEEGDLPWLASRVAQGTTVSIFIFYFVHNTDYYLSLGPLWIYGDNSEPHEVSASQICEEGQPQFQV